MRVGCVRIPLAALVLALSLGCQRQPGPPGAPDGAVEDAGADGRSDRGAARVDASARDRSEPDAAHPDANRRDANRPDAATADARVDAMATDGPRADGPALGTFELLGAPLVFAPTSRGFGLSVVLRSGDPRLLHLRVRDQELSAWTVQPPPLSPAVDLAQWTVDGLVPGRRYVYEVSTLTGAGDAGQGAGAG